MDLSSDIALLVALFLASTWPVAMEGAPPIQIKPRIVGGRPAHIAAYPFTVSVQVRLTHACGGSIVNSHYVVTAAHCFYNPTTLSLWSNNMVSVLAGSTVSDTSAAMAKMQIEKTIQRCPVRRMLFAPGHISLSDGGGGPDVGLIEVATPFQWTKWVQPAPLPFTGNKNSLPPPPGMVCQTMGWGHTGPVPTAQEKEETGEEPQMYPSFVLNVVELPILEFAQCLEYYETVTPELHLCTLAKGKDACNGDSGGPMICDGKQVAIVMAGDGCAQPGAPGAFSRLTPHLRWIWSVANYKEGNRGADDVDKKKPTERKGRGKATSSYPTTIFNVIFTGALLILCH